MDPEQNKDSPVRPVIVTQGVASSLSAMYVLAVLLLLLGSIFIIAMMFVPSGWSLFEPDEPPLPVYRPTVTPLALPVSEVAGLDEPAGVYPLERGRYRIVLEAFNWEFDPKEIRLPVGAEVEIVARSSQDFHGFAIAGTDIVLQLVHNKVARASYTFDKPGEYLFVCAEYCGAGHVTMTGKIIVE